MRIPCSAAMAVAAACLFAVPVMGQTIAVSYNTGFFPAATSSFPVVYDRAVEAAGSAVADGNGRGFRGNRQLGETFAYLAPTAYMDSLYVYYRDYSAAGANPDQTYDLNLYEISSPGTSASAIAAATPNVTATAFPTGSPSVLIASATGFTMNSADGNNSETFFSIAGNRGFRFGHMKFSFTGTPVTLQQNTAYYWSLTNTNNTGSQVVALWNFNQGGVNGPPSLPQYANGQAFATGDGVNAGGNGTGDFGFAVGTTAITPTIVKGDFNFDGGVDASDIDPFVVAANEGDPFSGYIAASQAAFELLYPGQTLTAEIVNQIGDFNGDGGVDASDIDPFVVFANNGGAVSAIPEPAALGLLAPLGLLMARRRR